MVSPHQHFLLKRPLVPLNCQRWKLPFRENANKRKKQLICRRCVYTPQTMLNSIIWFWVCWHLKLKEEWTLTRRTATDYSDILYFCFSPKKLMIVYGFKICISENISPIYDIFHWASFLHGKKENLIELWVYLACLKFIGIWKPFQHLSLL